MKPIMDIAVIGAGFMGFQIALAASKLAKNRVRVYDVNLVALQKGKEAALKFLKDQKTAGQITAQNKEEIWERVSFEEDLSRALDGARLVIESVPENIELKRQVFQEVDRLAGPEAILATNSSSHPVSRLESATGRLDKVVNIHFYPPIEKNNMADVMGGTQTSEETIQTAEDWVRSLGCVVLRLKKELIGFCFNRVWHAARLEALKMWAGDYVDFRDIDRAWMIGMNSPKGPFALMDWIGLDVVYSVHRTYYDAYGDFYKPPEALKAMVDRGELGVKTGKGFYSYPDPEFARSDFLKT